MGMIVSKADYSTFAPFIYSSVADKAALQWQRSVTISHFVTRV